MLVPAPESPNWRPAPDIDITPFIREQVEAVATIYHAKTHHRLLVTSGRRSPLRQADAMYTKLIQGGSLAIYKSHALIDPLQKAWRDGRRMHKKRPEIVKAMAAVLADQVEHGQFISRHLRGRAFDVHSVSMTGAQRSAFIAAVHEVGGMRVIRESRPPHFHVEILTPDPASEPASTGEPASTDTETPNADPDQSTPEEPSDAPE